VDSQHIRLLAFESGYRDVHLNGLSANVNVAAADNMRA
jgi:hypothetical protein